MFSEFSWLELDRSIMKVYKRIGKRGGGGIEKERTNGPQKQDLKESAVQVALAEVEKEHRLA